MGIPLLALDACSSHDSLARYAVKKCLIWQITREIVGQSILGELGLVLKLK